MAIALRACSAVVLMLLVAACGTIGPQPVHEIEATDAQNGQSISVHVNDTVRITLNTTFWTVADSSDPSIVQLQGQPVVSPAPRGSCFPGMGCGTTTAIFKAMKRGSATVSASRASCGEARRCVGAEGEYQLTIVVD